MAVKMRLKRMGKKRNPIYRIVVADSRAPRDGRFIEEVGTYDPNQDPSIFDLKEDPVQKWLANGAQPTETVGKLLKIAGIEKQCQEGEFMKELVETIAKALVDSPDEVVVTESETEREIVLQLHVAQEDMGKVIGKQGRIAKAIRSVVKAAASKCDKKVKVEIQ